MAGKSPQIKVLFSLLIWHSLLGEKKKEELLENIIYLIVELYQQHQVSTQMTKGKVLMCTLVLREDIKYLFIVLDNTTKNQFQLFYVACHIVLSGIHLISCIVITYNFLGKVILY